MTDSLPSIFNLGLLRRRPDRLELSTTNSPRPGAQQQQLQATTEYRLFQMLLSTLSAADTALYECMIDTDIDESTSKDHQ